MNAIASSSGGDPGRQDGALGSYTRAVRTHALVVVVIIVMAGAAAAAWLSAKEPSYTATAEVLITPLPADDRVFLGLQLLRDSSDLTRTAQTAAALIASPSAAKLTAERLGDGVTQASVENNVTVEPQGQSSIIAVSGRDKDPQAAVTLANTYVESALRVRSTLMSQQIAQLVARLQDDTAPETVGRVAELRSFADGDDPTITLSQLAAPPSTADGAPRWLILALAVIAGCAIASGVALLMDLASRRLRDAQEIQDAYQVPVLGRIPALSRRTRRRAGPLVLPPAAREAFRTLQAQIDQGDDYLPRTVMVTSANSGDGKTSCAVNLGLALVAAGRQVVLLDFDLRKPDLGRILGVEDSPGLVSWLRSEASLDEILVQVRYVAPLRVAVAGTGDRDMLMLAALSRRAPEILEQAKLLADFVILDTPPLGEVSDALRLSSLVDDVLLVARPGHTRRDSFEHTRDLLARAGRPATGLVLFRVSGTPPSAYYTYGESVGEAQRRRALARLTGR